LLFPAILILALEKTISAETTTAILGGLAGYLLSDIGRYKPEDSNDKPHTEDDTKN
jgi:hypothetical protein